MSEHLHRQKAHVLPGVWVVVGVDQDSLKTDSPSLRFKNPARYTKVQVHRDSRNEKAQLGGWALSGKTAILHKSYMAVLTRSSEFTAFMLPFV